MCRHSAVVALPVLAFMAISCLERDEVARRELEHRGVELTAEALVAAVKRDDGETIRLLIQSGTPGGAALLASVRTGRCTALESLLGSGLEVSNLNGARALSIAIARRKQHCVDLLVAAGAQLDARNDAGQTVLLQSARRRSKRRLRALLSSGADPDLASWSGETPLMAAAAGGRENNISLLLRAGVELEARDRDGWTALHYAVRNGHPGAARRLIRAGAEVDAVSDLGWTPLMWAARSGSELVGDLLSAGAEVDILTRSGFSALIQAVRHGHQESVQRLLEAGAQPAQGLDGADAVWWARRKGRPEIAELLSRDPRRQTGHNPVEADTGRRR